MKFLSGLVIGVLLCAVIFGIGGYYAFNRLKVLQPASPAQTAAPREENNFDGQLQAALNAFTKASPP